MVATEWSLFGMQVNTLSRSNSRRSFRVGTEIRIAIGEVKIDNVQFVKDFSELANGQLGEFDIVLSHHAIRFEIDDSSGELAKINSYFESTTDPSVVALNAANLLSGFV